MTKRVFDRLGQGGLGRYLGQRRFERHLEIAHQRRGLGLANLAAVRRAGPADLSLDRVDFREPLNGVPGHGRLGLLVDVGELAARMRRAER